eukprot:Awhi_evm1s6302
MRRSHREHMVGQMFYDSQQLSNPNYLNLPEALRARPPTLLPHQMKIYMEDFTKLSP